MIILEDPERPDILNPVVTIGSFDGVHRGHLHVISALRRLAEELNGIPVVITFEPHPRMVLFPDEPPVKVLSSFEEKRELLEMAGINHLILLPFTHELAETDYRTFVKSYLVDRIGVKGVVAGYDHTFGKDREGSYEKLLSLGEEFGFSVAQVGPLCDENGSEEVHISSTKIRQALMRADLKRANTYLGYEYGFRGVVVKGHSLGRELGFPTANISIDDVNKELPLAGVYAVKVLCDGRWYGGMMNIGVRPTVSRDGKRCIEVHLFDLAEEIYGKSLKVTLLEWMREEREFESIEALKEQLNEDKLKATAILRSAI